MRIKSVGSCDFCNKILSGNQMTKHLSTCKERINTHSSESKQGKILLIHASDGPFWVYFEVAASSKLSDIDSFLRDLWLDCCGHLSKFTINRVTYAIDPQPEYGDKNMNVKLYSILTQNTEFIHEYDFGTTTTLKLKCISEREGMPSNQIDILAQNDLPDFMCTQCEKPAKHICPQCIYIENALLCDDHVKKHKCWKEECGGEDVSLPVVNSPRMGMCGYTGE